jgi:hypothetical protein
LIEDAGKKKRRKGETGGEGHVIGLIQGTSNQTLSSSQFLSVTHSRQFFFPFLSTTSSVRSFSSSVVVHRLENMVAVSDC